MVSSKPLLQHKVVLSVGHDEYWSRRMRDNLEAARDSGVNLAFFSSNTSYWQVRFEPSGAQPDRIMVAFKNAGTGQMFDIDTRVTYQSGVADAYDAGTGVDLRTHLWRNAGKPEVDMLGTGGVMGEAGYDAGINSYDSYLSVPFVLSADIERQYIYARLSEEQSALQSVLGTRSSDDRGRVVMKPC
jgi:hypothetical protein